MVKGISEALKVGLGFRRSVWVPFRNFSGFQKAKLRQKDSLGG
jgi:hypothetical protein